jgi:hypothetical protein
MYPRARMIQTPYLCAELIFKRIISGMGIVVIIMSQKMSLNTPPPNVTILKDTQLDPYMGGNVQNAFTGLAVN